MIPNGDEKHILFYLQTLLLDFAARLLKNMEDWVRPEEDNEGEERGLRDVMRDRSREERRGSYRRRGPVRQMERERGRRRRRRER